MGQALKIEPTLKLKNLAPARLDAHWMAQAVMRFSPATDSEALKLLRSSFPDCPLSLRVAALDLLMRHNKRPNGTLPR